MDKPTVNELMDDLLAMVFIPERAEGEFTPGELAEKSGITMEAMRHRLERLLDSGLVEKKYAMIDGLKKLVYKKK